MFAPLTVAGGWARPSCRPHPPPAPPPLPPLPCRVARSAEARTVSARKNGQCKTQRGCRRRRYRFKGSVSLSRWLGLGTPRCRLSGSSTQPPGWLFSSHAPRNGLRTLSRGVVAKYRHKAAISAQLFSVTGEQSGRPRRAPCGPGRRGSLGFGRTVLTGGRPWRQVLVTASCSGQNASGALASREAVRQRGQWQRTSVSPAACCREDARLGWASLGDTWHPSPRGSVHGSGLSPVSSTKLEG